MRIVSPHARGIREDRGADIDELERLPVRIEALLEREHRLRGAGLITQRITAQTVVAAEQ